MGLPCADQRVPVVRSIRFASDMRFLVRHVGMPMPRLFSLSVHHQGESAGPVLSSMACPLKRVDHDFKDLRTGFLLAVDSL